MTVTRSRSQLRGEHADVATVATDANGRVTHWGPGAEHLLGVPTEQALGRHVEDVLGPRGDGGGELAAALSAGRPLETDSAVEAEGYPRLCRIVVAPMEDASGRVGAFAVVAGISEDRRVERRLRAQYAATRALAESGTVEEAAARLLRGVAESIEWHAADLWVVDGEAAVIWPVEFWSAAGVEMGAFERATRETVFRFGEGLPGNVWSRGETVWIPNLPDEPAFHRAATAAADGLRTAFAFPIRLGDRVLGAVELFHLRSLDPDPDLMEAMEAVGSQVGQFIERARAVEAVRTSEARKAALLESVLDCVVSVDRDGRIVEFNAAAQAAFGHDREVAVGREMFELLFPPRVAEELRAAYARYADAAEGPMFDGPIETAALRRDGTEFPVELAIAREAGTGPLVVTAYMRDLSERRRAEEAVREGERRFEQALEAGNMGAWEWDVATGTVTWSPSLERIHGMEQGTFSGTFEAFLADAHPEDGERLQRSIREAMEDDRGAYRIEYRIVRPDGEVRWLEARGEVRRDREGRPVAMAGICADITSRREAEEARDRLLDQAEEARERLAFLAEASVTVSASLNVERTLEKVARLAVPTLADWCGIDMKVDGEIRPMVLVAADPRMQEVGEEIRRRYPPDLRAAEGVARAIRTGQPVLYPEVADELLAAGARDQEHLRLLRELDLRSAMVIPLVGRDRILGAIAFGAGGSRRPYGESDLALAEDLARRAAVAVDNARFFEERSYIARALQRSLLPPTLPEVEGFEIAARYQPTGEGNEVGGDFYDVVERGRNEWSLMIGDVCGKGPDAAALTGLARHTLRAAVMKDRRPSRALDVLNDAIIREGSERFCTAAVGRLVRRGERVQLTVSCGGHPRPHILRRDGSVNPIGTYGTLLGCFDDPEVSDDVVELGPGDAVIFYTDGLIEDRDPATAERPTRFRSLIQRCAFLGSAEALANCLEGHVRRLHPDGPRDDVAILVLRVKDE